MGSGRGIGVIGVIKVIWVIWVIGVIKVIGVIILAKKYSGACPIANIFWNLCITVLIRYCTVDFGKP